MAVTEKACLMALETPQANTLADLPRWFQVLVEDWEQRPVAVGV